MTLPIQGMVQRSDKDFFDGLSGKDGREHPKGRLVLMLMFYFH